MPRFYFNVFDGRIELDRTGTELPNWTAARAEAIRRTGQIFDREAHLLALGEDWQMEVLDEHGLILFRLDFHVTASPAARHDQARRGDPP